jgi:voltage-gated potassium channel
VSLGDVLRDPSDRERALACVALVALQGEEETIMPGPDYQLRPGCQILFAGTLQAQRLLNATLNNEYTLGYLMTGIDPPRGLVMQWISQRLGGAAPQAAG